MLKIATGFGAIGIIFALIFFTHKFTTESTPSLKNFTQQSKPQENVRNDTSEDVFVDRVVDEDTIVVRLQNNNLEKVRIIGINAPESVDPRRAVECYGKEASTHLTGLIAGKTVRLEPDDSQQNKDKYGRLLRHVFFRDMNVAESMIRDGYAYEYTYSTPYKYQKIFKIAQREAENNKVGLWVRGVCK